MSAAQAAHPKYLDMISNAIKALADKSGSSRQAINKYIVQEYKLTENNHHKAMLNKALKRGSDAKGPLVHNKGKGAAGSFKLRTVVAKAKPAKKPVAKKAPKKKAAPKKTAKASAKTPAKPAEPAPEKPAKSAPAAPKKPAKPVKAKVAKAGKKSKAAQPKKPKAVKAKKSPKKAVKPAAKKPAAKK